jgi:5-methylcytosine-specific restriction enzyme subunit McrC
MLLYAKTQENIVPDDKMQLKDGNTIYFRMLDLNQEFAGICKRLENLIEKGI